MSRVPGNGGKVLINCVVHPDGLEVLHREGYETIIVPEVDQQASWDGIGPCVALLANASLRLDEKFFAAAPNLRVIGRHGVGYDNVDLDAARRRKIRLVNTPLPIIEPVAEHTIMLMLAVTRRLVAGHNAVVSGRWRDSSALWFGYWIKVTATPSTIVLSSTVRVPVSEVG